jgi:hypothetical protein
MTKATTESSATSRISTFVLAIIYVVLVLAVIALIIAAYAFSTSQPIASYGSLAFIGVVALILSGYMLFQSERRRVKLKLVVQPTMTQIECMKCKTKTVREFKRGDFVFKELDACQKCPEEKQIITAIYKEVKEKEKQFPF